MGMFTYLLWRKVMALMDKKPSPKVRHRWGAIVLLIAIAIGIGYMLTGYSTLDGATKVLSITAAYMLRP